MQIKLIAAFLSLHSALAWSGELDVPREYQESIVEAVGKVGQVLPHDQAYTKFHEELKDRFKDTPDAETFMAREQWVNVITSTSLRYAGIFLGRSKAEAGLKRGDIVRMKLVPNFRKVSTYEELNLVTEVICRVGTPEYNDCASANPLKWLDGNGIELRPGK